MLKTILLSNVLDLQVSGPFVVVQWISETSVRLAAIDGSRLSFHPVVDANRLRKTLARAKGRGEEGMGWSAYFSSEPVVSGNEGDGA